MSGKRRNTSNDAGTESHNDRTDVRICRTGQQSPELHQQIWELRDEVREAYEQGTGNAES